MDTGHQHAEHTNPCTNTPPERQYGNPKLGQSLTPKQQANRGRGGVPKYFPPRPIPHTYFMPPQPTYPPHPYPPTYYVPVPAPEGIGDPNQCTDQRMEQEQNEETYDGTLVNKTSHSSSYIVDSGCTPSYIKTPHRFDGDISSQTILADERKVKTYGR